MAPSPGQTPQKKAEQRANNGSNTGKQEGLFEHEEVCERNNSKTSVETDCEKRLKLKDVAFNEWMREMYETQREQLKADREEMTRCVQEKWTK